MGKTKQRDHSEVEHLRGLVRQLKSENRNLRKRLKTLERREHMFEEVLEESNEEIDDIKLDTCPKCKIGIITETDYKFVIIKRCGSCEYTERKKKI